MSEPKVELKRMTSNSGSFTSSSTQPWPSPSVGVGVGDLNPTYQGVNNDNGNPMSGNQVYDSVGGGGGPITGAPPSIHDTKPDHETKPAVPPSRKVTTNAIYEPSAETKHPQTLTSSGYMNGTTMESDAEYDDDDTSGYCLRTVCLSVLVGISLFLAIIAVVLVLLLWFGVIKTTVTECSATTGSTTNTNSRSVRSADTGSCSCADLDIQPTIDMINEEAANLSSQIDTLLASVEYYTAQSTNLSSLSDSLSSSIGTVNSSCLESLDAVTDQLGSIQGLNFNAQLLNVGVFNSCIYEYVDECQIPETESSCQTNYTSAIVPGYFNLDLACHIGVSEASGSVLYAPITNIRFNTTISVDSNTPADDILENSMVRCECSTVAINSVAMRNEIFHCKLYRSRCLSVDDFHTTIVT